MALGPDYRRLWAAAVVSNVGDGVRLAALPLLAATLTREPGPVAAVTFAGTLPWLLFALVSGALVDRLDRRLVMARANAFRALVVAGLALAVVTGVASIPLLCVAAFVLGTAETLFDNASQAILPSVVERDQLELANGRSWAAEITANQFVGPPLGGFLFAAAAAAPFLLDAGSFAVSAALLLGLRGRFTVEAAAPRQRLHAEIAEGLRWLWGHRFLRTVALVLGTLNLVSTAYASTEVLFALEVLGVGEVGYGLLFAAGAVGGAAGSLLAPRVSDRLGPGRAILVSVLGIALSSLVIGATSSPWVAGVLFAVSGFGSMTWNVVTVSLRQAIIPAHLLGRVNSVYRLMAWGSMPLGAVLGGFLASTFGLRAPVLVAGFVQILLAVVVARRVDTRAIMTAREAAPA